jgi:2-alkyl-3-oxoalkanoate reductase
VNRTVLVTGGAGLLGAALVQRLAERGWRTRALVRRRPVPTAAEQVSGDVCDPSSLRAAVDDVDGILHLAAITHARNDREYERVNLEGTRNLVAAAADAGVQRFVFVSSRAVAADGGAYARTKLLAEESVRTSAVGHVIVRLPELLTGTGSEGVNRIVESAAKGAAIPVVGRGESQVCPVLLEDVLDPLVEGLDRPQVVGKTYTLAGECVSMREFAEACVKRFASSSRIVRVPEVAVAGLCLAARVLPLPLYPDQLARLLAAKAPASPEAGADLGFRPRGLSDSLAVLVRPR